MLVRKTSGITDLKGFQGKSVCVETGTTTELNLTDQMRQLGVTFTHKRSKMLMLLMPLMKPVAVKG